MIYNDTKLEPISWELNLENPLFNFCVGVWVGGHPRANLWPESKDAHKTSKSDDRGAQWVKLTNEKPAKNWKLLG